MGHWTPTGIEPTDYDDGDDDACSRWSVCFQRLTEWAETWRRVWGTETKFAGRNFRMTFFLKIFILTSKISDDLFSLLISTVNLILCNVYDHFLAEKPLFQSKTLQYDTFF